MCKKDTADDQSYPFLSAAPKIDKTVENMRKQNEKKSDKGIVCSKDVKPMKLGEWKRIEEDDNSEGVIRDNFKADT